MHEGSFQLEELKVDSISAVLSAPVCSHLAATLHKLDFWYDLQAETFTEEQEQALQVLASLQHLGFYECGRLQFLPQGLHQLSSLRQLVIHSCGKIQSLPPKEGLPTSLRNLLVWSCNPELTEQAEKLKGTNPCFTIEVVGYSAR